jgi:hypothetical protein
MLLPLGVSACGGADEQVGSEPPSLCGTPTVTLYAAQPMVVDVRVELTRAATVSVELPEDLGVHSDVKDASAAGEVTLRVRGLAPDSDIFADIIATVEDRRERLPISFHTAPGLAGFVPSFEVAGVGEPSPEYRLFDYSSTPKLDDSGIYAVDIAGRSRFYLASPCTQSLSGPFRPPTGLRLLSDGKLLWVQDGRILIQDELGQTLTELPASDYGVLAFHHDVIELPNGNLMTLGVEFSDVTLSATNETFHVAGDLILELSREGDRLWMWSSFEHLDTQRVLEDFYDNAIYDPAVDAPAQDWTHANAILYSAEDDSVLLSLRHQDWLVKIDRATGNVVWRLGKDGDFTLASGSWFFHQHSPEWQPDGSLLMYDNGVGNPALAYADQHSRPARFEIDEEAKTAKLVWDETNEAYVSPICGDADRTSTGSVLVTDSSIPLDPTQPAVLSAKSRIREVDPSDNTWLWSLTTPDEHLVYRALPVPRLPGEIN